MCLSPYDVVATQEIYKKISSGNPMTPEDIQALEKIGLPYSNLEYFTKLYDVKENVSSVLVK